MAWVRIFSAKAWSTLLVVVVILLHHPGIDGAKILTIPNPVYSHFNQNLQLSRVLQQEGHEVTLIVPDFLQDKVLKHNLKALVYDGKHVRGSDQVLTDLAVQDIGNTKTLPLDLGRMAVSISQQCKIICDAILSDEKMMAVIQKEGFDLALMGTLFSPRGLVMIPYKFDIPFITHHYTELPWAMGVPASPAVQPSPFTAGIIPTPHMSLYGRTLSLLGQVMSFRTLQVLEGGTYLDRYAPDKPVISLTDLYAKAQLHFISINTLCLDYPRITAPNYHFLSPIVTMDSDPVIPPPLSHFIEGAEHGFIVFTFGSTEWTPIILKHILPKLTPAFAAIKQRVILHWKSDDPIDVPSNVRVEKWLPQISLLKHPKCVLLINHGGANGQNEAVYYGVPMIGIAVSDEQRYNIRRIVDRGYGLELRLYEFTSEDLVAAIHEVTRNSSYRDNTKHCSDILKSVPDGISTFALWTNHVLKFGGGHLRSVAADMPLYQLFMLDVVAMLLLVLSLIILTLICLAIGLRRYWIYSRNIKQKQA